MNSFRRLDGEVVEEASADVVLAELLRPLDEWRVAPSGGTRLVWKQPERENWLVVERATEDGWVLRLENFETGLMYYRVQDPAAEGYVTLESGGDLIRISRRHLCTEDTVRDVVGEVLETGWVRNEAPWDPDPDIVYGED